MIGYKYPTIASGATPIGSAGRAPDKKYFEKNEEENFESIIGGKHQKMNSTFTPIGSADSRTRRFQEVKELKSKIQEVKD
jgi:hypothetical protein